MILNNFWDLAGAPEEVRRSPVTSRYSCSECWTSYVYSLAHILIPLAFTHADSPFSCALLRLPCPLFQLFKERSGPNGIQSPSGWLPLAGFKRGRGRGALARDEVASDCSGFQMEISLRGRGSRRIMQLHMPILLSEREGELLSGAGLQADGYRNILVV